MTSRWALITAAWGHSCGKASHRPDTMIIGQTQGDADKQSQGAFSLSYASLYPFTYLR
jgi:hypothetical protein